MSASPDEVYLEWLARELDCDNRGLYKHKTLCGFEADHYHIVNEPNLSNSEENAKRKAMFLYIHGNSDAKGGWIDNFHWYKTRLNGTDFENLFLVQTSKYIEEWKQKTEGTSLVSRAAEVIYDPSKCLSQNCSAVDRQAASELD